MVTHAKTLTYEDFLRLPEIKQRYEVIDGELISLLWNFSRLIMQIEKRSKPTSPLRKLRLSNWSENTFSLRSVRDDTSLCGNHPCPATALLRAEAYHPALEHTSSEAFEGRDDDQELGQKVNCTNIEQNALELITTSQRGESA